MKNSGIQELRNYEHWEIIKSLKSYHAGKKTRELCQAISKLINKARFQKDLNLKQQIWKAAGSAMDNIAEGFDDGSSREFIRFLGYSQRSCGEVQSQLYRALDCGYINNSEFNIVYDLASDCRKQIKGFRKYLRNYKKD